MDYYRIIHRLLRFEGAHKTPPNAKIINNETNKLNAAEEMKAWKLKVNLLLSYYVNHGKSVWQQTKPIKHAMSSRVLNHNNGPFIETFGISGK